MLRLYNTLTRRKEVFKPVRKDWVGLYTCGPTVYDFAHIGNLRSYIFADIARRVLRYNGYAVKWVMNITDVDDKTIRRTIDEYGSGATVQNLREYTERYFKAFREDLKKINIPTDEPDITFIRVSEKIEEIKFFIKKLIALGFGYKTEDGVYFSISKYQKKFGDYGDLVGKNFLKGAKVGLRVKVDDYEKEHASDFALWKGRDKSDGNIFWPDKELGDGRPGWHVECSAINQEAFGGRKTDIHTGGVDLIFPHHTNEIAQSAPVYAPKKFVNHWLHNEHLLVNGKKMAKRERNFYTLDDFIKITPHAGLAFRYITLQTHYRAKMNFRPNMGDALHAIGRLNSIADKSKALISQKIESKFRSALNNDLNTSQALAAISEARDLGMEIKPLLGVLGLIGPKADNKIPLEVRKLARQREVCRANKQFIQSDRLRKEINALGYEIEDTPDGPTLCPKNPN